MERAKIHIIFSGDSFSDDGTRLDTLDYLPMDLNLFKYKDTAFPATIKLHHMFAYDLIQNDNYNVVIHTLGRGSYGNHVIADKFKKKVLEIKNNHPNEKIYGVIQFSAFIRQGFKPFGVDINLEDYPFDYLKDEGIIQSDLEKEIFEKHFENIENLNQFCMDNGVKHYMFFGWANIFTNDIERLHLQKRFENIKRIVNFYKYKDSYDEIESYCAGRKPMSVKDFFSFGMNKMFLSLGDDFGGLTEFARDRLDIGHRYNLPFDPHPSTEAYYTFYTKVLKEWFIRENILPFGNMNWYVEIILKQIFKVEYLKFSLFSNAGHDDIETIYSTLKWIVDNDKMEDTNFIINEFKKINRKF